MTTRTHRQNLDIMARAFVEAMGYQFSDENWPNIPDNCWFIERADTEQAMYRLAERNQGGIHHPLTSKALTARELADALYIARLAVGIFKQENY